MLAFTFPGQGSQRPGMGRPWVDHESWALVAQASQAAGRDVAGLLLDADAEELRDTRNAQLTTFVLSMVVRDAVERLGVAPAVCAGHSLGEYSALVAAGVLSFEDGVRLVVARADAMHAAGRAAEGTMAAVLGLEVAAVGQACDAATGDAWVANDNAPGQVVIAGSPAGVDAAGAEAKRLGAKKVMALPVSGAFHTPFMAPARDALQAAVEAARPRDAAVPVVANVDARAHVAGSEWRELLAAQLTAPVRWRESLQALAAAGACTVVELGPGGVLTGLAKRTLDGVRAGSVATPEELGRLLDMVGAGAGHRIPVARTA